MKKYGINYSQICKKSSSGFSLTELMIAISLVVILGYGIMQFKSLFTEEVKRVEIKAETVSGVGLANKILVKDFILSGPSFSFIDRKANKISCISGEITGDDGQFWNKNTSAKCYGTQVVLEGNEDSFSFVVSDYLNSETVFLLPEKAYNYTNTLGSDLTFSKSKLINFFKETDVDIWKKDSFYKLQANSNIIDVNYSSDPIKYSIMFSSSENNIVDYFDDNIIQVLFEKCSGKSNYDGLDLFFRCMPLDGSDFRIKAQAVRYITYRLSKPSEDYKYKGFILYKDERKLDNGKVYIKSTNLVGNIKKLIIKRKDASSNIISFDIKFYSRKRKEEKQ